MKLLKTLLVIIFLLSSVSLEAVTYSDVTSALFVGDKDGNMIVSKDCSTLSNVVITGSLMKPLKFCANLIYEGYFDWRLPTLEELLQIEKLGFFPKNCPGNINIGTFTRVDERVNLKSSKLLTTDGDSFVYYNRNSSSKKLVLNYFKQNSSTTGSYICVR